MSKGKGIQLNNEKKEGTYRTPPPLGKLTRFQPRVWEQSPSGKWYSREATKEDKARRNELANRMGCIAV